MPAATQDKVERLKQVVIGLKATIAQAEFEQAETQRILQKMDREEPCAVQSMLNEQLDAALRSIQDQLRSMCVNAVDELSLLETMHTRNLLRAEEERKQLSDQVVALDSKLTTCKEEVTQLKLTLRQKEQECKQTAGVIQQLKEDKLKLDKSAKESQEASAGQQAASNPKRRQSKA